MADTNQPFRVYLLDGDASVRAGLSRLLRVSGLDVKAYQSAEEFLAEVTPDWKGCVLLDMNLPRQTGLQILQQLRDLSIRMPVIAMSERDDDGREAARALGARFFLHMPVDGQALFDAISWVTGNARNDTPC